MHFGIPCGTASRARLRRLSRKVHGPPPLRSSKYQFSATPEKKKTVLSVCVYLQCQQLLRKTTKKGVRAVFSSLPWNAHPHLEFWLMHKLGVELVGSPQLNHMQPLDAGDAIRTRLPYNCVSCENLSEKDQGPSQANPIITKNKNPNSTKPATRKSPSQICVSPQKQQQNNKETGQGQQKHHRPIKLH